MNKIPTVSVKLMSQYNGKVLKPELLEEPLVTSRKVACFEGLFDVSLGSSTLCWIHNADFPFE